MSDPLKEQLSAFLDGELPAAEAELFLKRLERDDELVATLSRYSLIGAAMRGEGGASGARPLAARVSAAIAGEPALAAAPAGRRWGRHAAGLGLAASVALAAVLLLGPAVQDPAQAPLTAAAPAVAPVAAAPLQQVAATGPAVAAPAPSYTTPTVAGELPPVEFANFLVAHSEQASFVGRRVIVNGLVASPAPAPEAPPAQAAPVPAEPAR